MKSQSSGPQEKMSRREFLKVFRLRNHGLLTIDKEKCTGCSLCAIDCPTKALLVDLNRENDTYQLLFRQEACDGCGVCEKSCPEHCLQFIEKESEKSEPRKETRVIFEDNFSRCNQCGIRLFPRSMVRKLEAKLFANKGSTWQINLCPSCRTKTPFTLTSPSPQPGEGKSEGTSS